MDERVVLVQRKGQRLERIARAIGEQRMRELLARVELACRYAGHLAQDPLVMRALALAMLRRIDQLEAILARPGAARERLADRKKIQPAFSRLRGEVLEPLRRRLRRANSRREQRQDKKILIIQLVTGSRFRRVSAACANVASSADEMRTIAALASRAKLRCDER